jgi:hypothetical protein
MTIIQSIILAVYRQSSKNPLFSEQFEDTENSNKKSHLLLACGRDRLPKNIYPICDEVIVLAKASGQKFKDGRQCLLVELLPMEHLESNVFIVAISDQNKLVFRRHAVTGKLKFDRKNLWPLSEHILLGIISFLKSSKICSLGGHKLVRSKANLAWKVARMMGRKAKCNVST